jgi:uncharacterized BrkB/YihY/UPF0761 family membrane protein
MHVIKTVRKNCPEVLIIPVIYLTAIAIVLYYTFPNTVNEWVGFLCAATLFFSFMVVAPVLGTYYKYHDTGKKE